MSSTKKARRLSLAIRSPSVDAAVVGAAAVVAVAAAAVVAAVAAGEGVVVVAAAAAAAACHGDVAASAKGTLRSNPTHNKPQPALRDWPGPNCASSAHRTGAIRVFVPLLGASQ